MSAGLQVTGLYVRYGQAVAVNDLGLQVRPQQVVGLIGPNGAGKTTTFNACCGLVRATAGRIELDGRDITTVPPQVRARLGLGRTFQRMELFGSQDVRANVAIGREAKSAANRPWRHLACSRGTRRLIDAAVDDALELCGIADLARREVAGLSSGQQRLVELARAVAGEFSVLLLDEPSSGLDVAETARFGDVLRHLVDERRVAILLVEHDMGLVMTVCDYLHVIDFGVPIFEGTPEMAQASPVVRSAYLGEVE